MHKILDILLNFSDWKTNTDPYLDITYTISPTIITKDKCLYRNQNMAKPFE